MSSWLANGTCTVARMLSSGRPGAAQERGCSSLQPVCSFQCEKPVPGSSHSESPGVSMGWVGDSLKSALNQALMFPGLFKQGPGEHPLGGSVTIGNMKWIPSSNVQC